MKNVFALRFVGGLLASSWSLRTVRLLLLALLLVMVACGWHHHAIPGVDVRDPLMYSNLANHGFWVWWMMGVVFIAGLCGRLWCGVCPVGWLASIASRYGLSRRLPKALQGHLPVTLTLIGLQLSVYLWSIHRFPDYTARLMALMVLMALGLGLIFSGRAFCSLLCPAGAVFGLYARFSPMRLFVADRGVCSGCQEQGCVRSGEVVRRFALGRALLFWKGERSACPEQLEPEQIGASPACSACLGCVSGCSFGNVVFGLAGQAARRQPLTRSETVFFLVLLGLLTANFSKTNVVLRDALLLAPENLARLLGWEASGFYLLATPWVTLALPLLLLLPGYLVARLSQLKVERVEALPQGEPPLPPAKGKGLSFLETAGHFALAFVPLLLAVHLVLALVKLNAKGVYLPFVAADPSGIKSYLAMNVMHTVVQPGVLISLDLLKYLVLAVLAAGYGASLWVAGRGRSVAKGLRFGAWVSLTLTTSLYLATVVRWLFIR